MFRFILIVLFVPLPTMPTELFAQFLKSGEYYVKAQTVKVKAADGASITLTRGDRLLVTPVVGDQQSVLAGLDGREIAMDHEHLISRDEAIAFFSRATKEKPTARNLLARGKTYMYAHGRDKPAQPQKALADINRAIRLEPKMAEAYFWRAELNRGDPDNFIADYTKAIELNPKFAMAYFRRAMRRDQEIKPDKIVADYISAMTLDPTWNEAWRTYLRFWKDLNTWVDEEPQLETRAVNVALSFFDKEVKRTPKLLTKTITYFRNETRPLAPHILGLYMRRGQLVEQIASYEKALTDYSTVIELDAKSRPHGPSMVAESYRRRAWILATCPNGKVRDGDKAVRDATKACETASEKDYEIFETLAAAYAEKGDFTKAIEWQEKALKLWDNWTSKKRLAYYRDEKPYREQSSEDLTKYGTIPKDLSEKTPQMVLQQFYDHLATGKVEKAAYLVAPDRDRRFQPNLIKSLDFVAKGQFGIDFNVLMTNQDDDGMRSLAIIRITHTMKKADDPKRTQFQGVFLERRIVGWMISPTFRLPFGIDSLSDESDPLHKWFSKQHVELTGSRR